MKKYLIVIGLFLSIRASSQDILRNIVFVEASGVTGIYSVNYERLLFKNQNVNLGICGGFALINDIHYNSRTVFPISLSLIKNIINNHFMEIRVGLANNFYLYKDYSGRGLGDSTNNYVPPKKLGIGILPSIGIGYRYQPETKGIFFNFLVQRITYFSEENWFGNLSLGVGYAF
jgi:hypothetical protein